MAWLARLDARSARWSPLGRWTFVGMKWGLVALGAWCWIGVWVARDVWLGVTQALVIGYVLWRDHWPRPAPPRPTDPAS